MHDKTREDAAHAQLGDDARPFDQWHERAGGALIGTGILISLAATTVLVARGLGLVVQGPPLQLTVYLWLGATGALMATIGAMILGGIQRLVGLELTGPNDMGFAVTEPKKEEEVEA